MSTHIKGVLETKTGREDADLPNLSFQCETEAAIRRRGDVAARDLKDAGMQGVDSHGAQDREDKEENSNL